MKFDISHNFAEICQVSLNHDFTSRRMRWAGHVARMGEERGCIGSWWGNRRERDQWET